MAYNMDALANQFSKEYDFLYANRDNVAGYDGAVNYFDEVLNGTELVKNFVEYRQDFISSDREAAAFAFACDALGYLD